MLSCALPQSKEDEALDELEAFLAPRVESARNGNFSTKTVEDIFNEVIQANPAR